MEIQDIVKALEKGFKVTLLDMEEYEPHSCHEHPEYKGVNKTKRDCKTCQKYYNYKHKK